MNLDDDRPVCDFCNLMIEEDESLEPIFVGELPKPKTIIIRSTGRKYHAGSSRARHKVLVEALQDSQNITLDMSSAVATADGYDRDSFATEKEMARQGITTYQSELSIDHDKVGVSIVIEPERETKRPSAEVCPNCARMFQSMSE